MKLRVLKRLRITAASSLLNPCKPLKLEVTPVFSRIRCNNISTTPLRLDEFTQHAKMEAEQKEKETRDDDREEEIKKEILDAALDEVAVHGWSRAAVGAAAVKLGYPSVVSGLATRGGVDLVLHHIHSSNDSLERWMEEEVAKMTENGSKKLPVGRFVRSAVVKRLMMNARYLESDNWVDALALLATPQVAHESLGAMQRLCDDVWYWAGDTSTDINWYSKRISLAAIYTATEVFMVQDKSVGFSDTWGFLDRRLEDLQALPSIKQLPQDISGVVAGVVTTAKNMAGIQK